jgi:hypothetical protein
VHWWCEVTATTRAALDATIVRLLGAHYAEFSQLAQQVVVQPETRPAAEARMRAILELFTPARRAALHAALDAGGDIHAGMRARRARTGGAR